MAVNSSMAEITPKTTRAVPVTAPVAQTKAKAMDGSVRIMRSAVPTLRVVRRFRKDMIVRPLRLEIGVIEPRPAERDPYHMDGRGPREPLLQTVWFRFVPLSTELPWRWTGTI